MPRHQLVTNLAILVTIEWPHKPDQETIRHWTGQQKVICSDHYQTPVQTWPRNHPPPVRTTQDCPAYHYQMPVQTWPRNHLPTVWTPYIPDQETIRHWSEQRNVVFLITIKRLYENDQKPHAIWSRQQLMSPYHYQHATFFTLSTRTMFFSFFSLHSSLKYLFCPHSSFHLVFAITFTYHNLIQNSLSNGPNKGWLDCKILWAMAPTRNGAGMILVSIRKGSYKTLTYLCLSHSIGIISVPSLKH